MQVRLADMVIDADGLPFEITKRLSKVLMRKWAVGPECPSVYFLGSASRAQTGR